MIDLSYIEVSENVVMMLPYEPLSKINNAPQTVTSICISLSESIVFIDCGVYHYITKKFRNDMENKFHKKTSHLILTHTHWDHVIAMSVFKDVDIIMAESAMPEIESLLRRKKGKSSEECIKIFNVEESMAKIIANAEIFIPNIIVKDELWLGDNGKELLFKVIGGHSAGSAFIYFPHDKILCGGDNLIECYFQRPGNFDEALQLYHHWDSLDIEKAIPGHGMVVTKGYLSKIRRYYEDLASFLEIISSKNLSVKEVLNHPKLPKYFGKSQENWTEGCVPGAQWINDSIKSWYRTIKRKQKGKK